MEDPVREAFESRVEGEGWDLQRMPSGGYYSTRTEDGLMMWRISRKAAIEEAAKLCEDDSMIAVADGYERFSRYSAECGAKIRALVGEPK